MTRWQSRRQLIPMKFYGLHDALNSLSESDPEAAELVKLRYFVRLTITEAAETLGISVRTANRSWSYARAFLKHEMNDE